jgi:hypothetical protein
MELVGEGEEERERRTVLARKYYSLATRLTPTLGLPYNQLAALASHNSLDQVPVFGTRFVDPDWIRIQ